MNRELLLTVTRQLLNYCRSNDWAGYDPYDALNSGLFKRLPFLDSWLPRLAMTQILKRSPINFRPLLMIPKTQNPKALGLFLTALLKLEKLGMVEDRNLIPGIVQNIINLRSSNAPTATGNREPSLTDNCQPSTVNRYYCWGYSFPWQGRHVLAPKGEPNLVCTVFVANALLDYFESQLHQPEIDNRFCPSTENCEPETVNCASNRIPETVNILSIATSAADYLLNELYWSEGDLAGFSYPTPANQTKVHNANFLGAALFCRIYKHTGETKYLEPALKAARYSASRQHSDGGWDYGEHDKQQWIDNFHTGFNLGALKTICNCLQTDEFEPHIRKGFEFYKDHFFREDGAPKYFHNKVYPIDIHSVAQSIITLTDFSDLDPRNVDLAHRVFEWVINNMWCEQGYFHYQITPYYKNRIPYMRWSQAWMLLALASLLRTKF
jgi:hypothetical protein